MHLKNFFLIMATFLALTPIKSILVILAPLASASLVKRIFKSDLRYVYFFGLASLISLAYNENLIINYVTSLLLLSVPITFILLHRTIYNNLDYKLIRSVFLFLFPFLIFNGLIGVAQYVFNPGDDSAIGFYGRSGLQTHGLATFYFLLGIWFLVSTDGLIRKLGLSAALIFFVTCFYGAGTLALLLSLLLASVLMSGRKWILSAVVIVTIIAVGLTQYYVSPSTFFYNYAVISRFTEALFSIFMGSSYDDSLLPRKLIAWLKYFEILSNNPESLFTGMAGGTFNSRAAFVLNGDYSNTINSFQSISHWHKTYIYPLWSSDILNLEYQDGTMNQPFSSVLALLAEYGVVAFSILLISYKKLASSLFNHLKWEDRVREFSIRVLIYYFSLLCIFENILEYPDIVFFYFVFLFWVHASRRENNPKSQLV